MLIKGVTVQNDCLEVETNQTGAKVHVMAFTFYDKGLSSLLKALNTQTSQPHTKTFSTFNTQVYNHKSLSDEIVYVLNRKNYQSYQGNYLQKPMVLLNRQFNEETLQQPEKLSKGDKSYAKKAQGMYRNICQENLLGSQYQTSYQHQSYKKMERENELDGCIKFLKQSSQLLCNLKTDGNGKVKGKVDLQTFQQVLVVVSDMDQVVYQLVDLEDKRVEVRDLVQQDSGQAGQCFISTRVTHCLPSTQSLPFSDLKGVEFQLVDSLQQVYELQSLLSKEGQIHSFSKWNQLNLQDKHHKYWQYSSHEVNLFLFFKDKPYFQLYIKPFLQNKIEKTFMDHYLLQNHSVLVEYSEKKLKQLNSQEVLLLLHYFANTEDSLHKVQSLARYVQDNTTPTDTQVFKRLFDQVMNSKEKLDNNIKSTNQIAAPPVQMLYSHKPSNLQYSQIESEEEYEDCEQFQEENLQKFQVNECIQDQMMEEDSYLEEREEMKQMFVQGKKDFEDTKEYVERQYLDKEQNVKGHYRFNQFESDYAQHLVQNPQKCFLSANFLVNGESDWARTFTLAVLDLEWQSATHSLTPLKDIGLNIEASQNAIVFYKEFKQGQKSIKQDILVSQRFFDPLDRFSWVDELKVEKDVEEYVVDKVYGCQLVVTNCSVSDQLLQVIFSIPPGALPVMTLDYIHQVNQVFKSFSSTTFQFLFYFPSPGAFHLQPACINRNATTIAIAPIQTLKVTKTKTKLDQKNLFDVLSNGTQKDILHYIETNNIHQYETFQIENIYHLLTDPQFYQQIKVLFEKRHFNSERVNEYAILHGDKQGFYKLLQSAKAKQTLQKEGICHYFDHQITFTDFILKEYFPLITSRVHKLQSSVDDKTILNVQLRQQYQHFLKYSVEKQVLNNQDKIIFIYYLLLQERVQEAIKLYKSIDREQPIECEIQFDYLQCYFDFYLGNGEFKVSRELVNKYLDYPVLHWRNYFYNIANLLAEHDGEELEDQRDLEELQQEATHAKLRTVEPQVSLVVQGQTLHIQASHVDTVTLFLYKIDLELMFSINPFILQQDTEQDNFTSLLPNSRFTLQLTQQQLTFNIPEEYAQCNLHLMVKGGNKKSCGSYLPNQLQVVVEEERGVLKVSDSQQQALPRVYVKVFVKLSNETVKFYKDGYTDLVGRFNYEDCSSSINPAHILKYSILIASTQHGCLIKQTHKQQHLNTFHKPIHLTGKNLQIFNKRMQQQNLIYQQAQK